MPNDTLGQIHPEILTEDAVRENDVSDIAALLAQLTGRAQVFSSKRLRDLVTDPHTTLVVVRNGAHIIGMGMLTRLRWVVADSGRIEDIVVDKNHRRQGVASSILHCLLSQAKEDGFKCVGLNVLKSNPEARAMYARLGAEARDMEVLFFSP